MKLRVLLRRIADEGAVFVRHGSDHDWYRNVITGNMASVPRHREIKETTAHAIIKQLSAPDPEEPQ